MIQFQCGKWYQAEGDYDNPDTHGKGIYFPSVKVIKRTAKSVTVEDEYGDVHIRKVSTVRFYREVVETFVIKSLGNARFYANYGEGSY